MFNADQPIRKAEDDRLNRSEFSKDLAKAIATNTGSQGFVIGLYGKWGSGKTSILEMVSEETRHIYKNKNQETIILKFNPWLCSDPGQLISQFLVQLSSEIKSKKTLTDNVHKLIKKYAFALEFAKAIPVVGNSIYAVGKFLEADVDSSNSSNNNIQELKDKISKEIEKNEVKITVTIDDIDRLSKEEIISVFQLVKSIADFPYTTYLLAFDRDIVIKALGDVQDGDGAEYLEKIIQLPFEIPVSDSNDIHNIFINKIEQILGDYPKNWEDKVWNIAYDRITPYLKTIRDVHRFTNAFTLKYSLLKEEINPIDLMCLTCVQVFEPRVYSMLPLYKNQLCGIVTSHKSRHDGKKENMQKAYDSIVFGSSDERKDYIPGLLTFLFTRLRPVSNEYLIHRKGNYTDDEKLNTRSVSHPDCFDRYFALTLKKGELSSNEIENLLLHLDEDGLKDEILRFDSSITLSFLKHLGAELNSNKIKNERAIVILNCLLACWDALKKRDPPSKFLIISDHYLQYISELLLVAIDKSKRYEVLQTSFANSDVSIDAVTLLLYYFKPKHDRLKNNENDEKNHEILTRDEVLKLEETFVRRVTNLFDEGKLLDSAHIQYILKILNTPGKKERIKIFNNIINSDAYLAKLISVLVGKDRVFEGIDESEMWKVNPNRLREFIDLNEAYNRMDSFIKTKNFIHLKGDEKNKIRAFLLSQEGKPNMYWGD